MVLELATWALMVAGGLFTMIGALGLVRMPELYTRMHAASVIDTLGAGLLLVGMMLAAGLSLVSLKLLFILGLLVFTGPVVTHALARAALHENIRPLLAEDRRGGSRGEGGRGISRAEGGRSGSRAEDDRRVSR
jgi:multicomponent Na+:H+ antiporter subunit G